MCFRVLTSKIDPRPFQLFSALLFSGQVEACPIAAERLLNFVPVSNYYRHQLLAPPFSISLPPFQFSLTLGSFTHILACIPSLSVTWLALHISLVWRYLRK